MTRRMVGKISPSQIADATKIGRARYAARGQVIFDANLDVNIACAEQAVALALNRKWEGEFHRPEEWRIWKTLGLDVGSLQVRTTSFVPGSILIDESDPDDRVFILVVDRDRPTFALAGWILARDAKKPEYRNSSESLGPPGFLVPQSALRSCLDLKLAPEGTKRGERVKDPAKDFAGTGAFAQRRYADDGSHPSKYGNVIRGTFALPCCRCQAVIPKGALLIWSRVTGLIHGDPAECAMTKPSKSATR